MGGSSFTVLREMGSFPLKQDEEIRFSIDVYRNYRYVSIRRYAAINGLWTPMREGITLSPEIMRVLTPKIEGLPVVQALPTNIQLGKFAKRPGICVVVSTGTLRGVKGLLFRQWQEDIGWTEKGICLPLEKLAEIKTLFKETTSVLDEQPEDDF